MTDRDLQHAIDAAVDRCARYLENRILPGLDPCAMATAIVEGLRDDDWRPVPRDPRIPRPGQANTSAAKRGAQEAREGLARRGLLKEGPAE